MINNNNNNNNDSFNFKLSYSRHLTTKLSKFQLVLLFIYLFFKLTPPLKFFYPAPGGRAPQIENRRSFVLGTLCNTEFNVKKCLYVMFCYNLL